MSHMNAAATENSASVSPRVMGIPAVAVSKPERPMLARDADAIYWMARYVERAEHIARLLLVNANLLIDVGDLAPRMQNRLWQDIFTVLHLPELPDDPDRSIAARVQKS